MSDLTAALALPLSERARAFAFDLAPKYRKLRGTRYIREGAEPLVEFIATKLQSLDLDETLDFYDDFAKWSTDTRDAAFLACNDRFYLLTVMCSRRDAVNPWLFERCREVEANPDGYLDLWARYHYKSTIITFAGAIQEILIDPEITICIFSHTRPIAGKFLRQIKQEFEQNKKLKVCFPDVVWADPRKQAPKWSEGEGICVIRKSNPKEATVEAWGLVDGQPTGSHFRLLIYDDIVTKRSVTNAEMIAKVTASWELSDNLGVGERTRKWHIGTRYNLNDTYQTLIERRIFKVRLYPATHNGRLEGKPVFISEAEWKRIKITQRTTCAAQMLQNPAAGKEGVFQPEWFKRYEIRPPLLNVYILVDSSRGRKRTSDRTAMAVIGVDMKLNKFLLDGFRHRMTLSERWQNLKYLHQKWSRGAVIGVAEVFVGYEVIGMNSDVEYMQEQMEREKYIFGVEELNWSGLELRAKEDRIERLQPDIEGNPNGSKFYFPNTVWDNFSADKAAWATWAYDPAAGKIRCTPIPKPPPMSPTKKEYLIKRGRISETVRPMGTGLPGVGANDLMLTKYQRAVIEAGQPWRVAQPIRQIDEDGNFYDLTINAFEELTPFPFKMGHDDLIDAMSRIYDMKIAAPDPAVLSGGIEELEEEYVD